MLYQQVNNIQITIKKIKIMTNLQESKIQYILENYSCPLSEYELVMDLLFDSIFEKDDREELIKVCKIIFKSINIENIDAAINDY